MLGDLYLRKAEYFQSDSHLAPLVIRMVFDFHRSCLQSAITVHWRKPTIFGDAKIDYYLLKVSLTEHVQNILRLHVYAYYTWPLTRHKAQVLTLRTSQVTLVPVTNTSVSNQPHPPPPTPPNQ